MLMMKSYLIVQAIPVVRHFRIMSHGAYLAYARFGRKNQDVFKRILIAVKLVIRVYHLQQIRRMAKDLRLLFLLSRSVGAGSPSSHF